MAMTNFVHSHPNLNFQISFLKLPVIFIKFKVNLNYFVLCLKDEAKLCWLVQPQGKIAIGLAKYCNESVNIKKIRNFFIFFYLLFAKVTTPKATKFVSYCCFLKSKLKFWNLELVKKMGNTHWDQVAKVST